MSLHEYHRKRHFNRTPEPKSQSSKSDGRLFVIQEHAATCLHFDFRLELDGVLKSWAVPKGPSLDPSVKRLAVQVEDHPVEYGSFEGIIPEGEYGAGTVMVWDQGEWDPEGDPEEGYRTGRLNFNLLGQKLIGGWHLIRTQRDRQWLLFKSKYDDAKATPEGDIVKEQPLSVLSGRSLDEIAADRDRVWGQDGKANTKKKKKARVPKKPAARPKRATVNHSRMPVQLEVQLATRADKAPDGSDWLHEIKFDGYRILRRIDGGRVQMISRNHKDWTARFAALSEAAKSIDVNQAILDGEMVALQPLQQKTSPFADFRKGKPGTNWVSPKLVAQVAFGSRTHDGIVRHSAFQGLREDKAPEEVTQEKVVPLGTALGMGKTAMKKRRSDARRRPALENGNGKYEAATEQFAGVKLTHPSKVLYPEQGITKLELAQYYEAVADWILPHIKNRPLVLVRCPAGCDKECFFQKHAGPGTPPALRQIPITEKSKTINYVVVDDVAGLISLAQVGALEIHAWGSQVDDLGHPDRLTFDLDPGPDVPWPRVVQGAKQVHEFLHQLGLNCFVKTTGGKGLHIVVPIKPSHDWDEVKLFCNQVADAIVMADAL
jgi:bifunctional non-homologous end joining protein LigD